MKANFTQNDLGKILNESELEDSKKEATPKEEQASPNPDIKIEQEAEAISESTELIQEEHPSEALLAEEELNNDTEKIETESAYSAYDDDYYEESSYGEESSNKKTIIIAASAVVTLVLAYFIYGALSGPTVPVETKPSAQELKMAQMKADSIKAAQKPVFAANELSQIALKRSINSAISALFNSVEKDVAIEHIQISNNSIIVEYLSVDRAKIAKSLSKFRNSNTVDDITTTDSKTVGATRLIRVSIQGNINSSSNLNSDMITNISDIDSAIRSAAQKQTVKISELSKVSANSYVLSAKISKRSLLPFLNEFNSSVANVSYNKLSIVNHDKSSQTNNQFTLTQRITAHFAK